MQYIIRFSSTFPPLTRSLSPHPKVRVEYPVVVLDIPHVLLNMELTFTGHAVDARLACRNGGQFLCDMFENFRVFVLILRTATLSRPRVVKSRHQELGTGPPAGLVWSNMHIICDVVQPTFMVQYDVYDSRDRELCQFRVHPSPLHIVAKVMFLTYLWC